MLPIVFCIAWFYFKYRRADTSANKLNNTQLEPSNNPKVLTKLDKEIDKAFESINDNITFSDIDEMHYLDKVLNEALRKYPPIGVIQRVCTKDILLPSGIAIAKDNIIMLPVFALHRDEKYYPNPDVFDPERFSSEKVSQRNKYVYLTFGEGHCNCIGNRFRFARLQVKVWLAWLRHRFNITEQNYTPTYERSPLGLRSPTTCYEFKLRNKYLKTRSRSK